MRRLAPMFFCIATLAGCGTREVQEGAHPPLILQTCTSPAARFYASEADGWAEYLTQLPGICPEHVVPVSAYDEAGGLSEGWIGRWTTDAWVFGSCDGKPALFCLPGMRDLTQFKALHFKAQDWRIFEVALPENVSQARMNAGGNIFVSPAIAGRYAYGRIIVGSKLHPKIVDFLRAQRIQAGANGRLIEIDTSWLKVGHVDEVVSFLPWNQPPGFRLVLPDPLGGLRLLENLPSESTLFRATGAREISGIVTDAGARYLEDASQDFAKINCGYLRIIAGRGTGQLARVRNTNGHRVLVEKVWDLRGPSPSMAIMRAREGRCENMPIWFEVPEAGSRFVVVTDSCMWLSGQGEEFPALVTAGELAHDPLLQKCAKRFEKHLRIIRNKCTKELGIAGAHEIRLPVLMGGDERARCAWWIAPNPVNLVYLDGTALFPKPFGPQANTANACNDVFMRAWTEQLKSVDCRALYVDGWNAHHRLDGGLRCGTNVLRRP